jgi:hypothetical protein
MTCVQITPSIAVAGILIELPPSVVCSHGEPADPTPFKKANIEHATQQHCFATVICEIVPIPSKF